MTRDEKIDYTIKMFYPRDCERMAVAYSQYFEGKGNKETIEQNEERFRKYGRKNGYSDAEIEQGLIYIKELARNFIK